MYELPGHFELQFFSPSANVEPNSESIGICLRALGEYHFFPTTAKEVRLTPEPTSRFQLQLIKPDESWRISFESRKVILRWNPVTLEVKSGEFFHEVRKYIKIIDELGIGQGARLSYTTSGLIGINQASMIDSAFRNLFKPIPTYASAPLKEWTSRFVVREEHEVATNLESLNLVTDIAKVIAESPHILDGESFDALQVTVDINTAPERSALRFDASDLIDFSEMAEKLAQRLFDEIQASII